MSDGERQKETEADYRARLNDYRRRSGGDDYENKVAEHRLALDAYEGEMAKRAQAQEFLSQGLYDDDPVRRNKIQMFLDRPPPAKPAEPKPPAVGQLESAKRGGVAGITFGFGDELVGLGSKLGAMASGLGGGSGDVAVPVANERGINAAAETKSVYERTRDWERAANAAAQEDNPWTYGLSEVAGSIPTVALSEAKLMKPLAEAGSAALRTMPRAAKAIRSTSAMMSPVDKAMLRGMAFAAPYGAAAGAGHTTANPINSPGRFSRDVASTTVGAMMFGAAGQPIVEKLHKLIAAKVPGKAKARLRNEKIDSDRARDYSAMEAAGVEYDPSLFGGGVKPGPNLEKYFEGQAKGSPGEPLGVGPTAERRAQGAAVRELLTNLRDANRADVSAAKMHADEYYLEHPGKRYDLGNIINEKPSILEPFMVEGEGGPVPIAGSEPTVALINKWFRSMLDKSPKAEELGEAAAAAPPPSSGNATVRRPGGRARPAEQPPPAAERAGAGVSDEELKNMIDYGGDVFDAKIMEDLKAEMAARLRAKLEPKRKDPRQDPKKVAKARELSPLQLDARELEKWRRRFQKRGESKLYGDEEKKAASNIAKLFEKERTEEHQAAMDRSRAALESRDERMKALDLEPKLKVIPEYPADAPGRALDAAVRGYTRKNTEAVDEQLQRLANRSKAGKQALLESSATTAFVDRVGAGGGTPRVYADLSLIPRLFFSFGEGTLQRLAGANKLPRPGAGKIRQPLALGGIYQRIRERNKEQNGAPR